MRFPGISERLRSLAPIIGAIGLAAALVAVAPSARAAIGTQASGVSPPPPPPPTPTPVNAFISLDVTAGDANTQITVSGSAFLPNESTGLYWDQPGKVAGASNADGNGNFTTKVKPFAGDALGLHRLCATVLPNPCASFTLQAVAVTPTPQQSPSPSPDSSPSPTATPSADTTSPTPVATTLNGIDLMLKPPFVILPIIAGAGLAIALLYWILSIAMRPRQKPLKSVAVAHLASRPDYAAEFGTPPVPPPPAPTPSAWPDVAPPAPPPAPETPPDAQPLAASEAPEAAVEEAPATQPEAAPQDPAAAPDEPPDLPEPGDY